MKTTKIELLDGFGGNVIDGTPQPGDVVRITYSNGAVRERRVPEVIQPPQKDYVFLHSEVSKAAIMNDGADSTTITMTFRQTADPTSAVLTQISGANRIIPIRDSRNMEYDLLRVSVVDGVVTFNYTSDSRGATVHIDREDVEVEVGGKQIILVNEPKFIVYRADITS